MPSKESFKKLFERLPLGLTFIIVADWAVGKYIIQAYTVQLKYKANLVSQYISVGELAAMVIITMGIAIVYCIVSINSKKIDNVEHHMSNTSVIK